MIDILSNNLFHAINTNNNKLLTYLIDKDCLLTDDEEQSVLGQHKVIASLIKRYTDYHISIINGVKDDENTLLLAYKLNQNQSDFFGSLVIRNNADKKICFIKNVIIK